MPETPEPPAPEAGPESADPRAEIDKALEDARAEGRRAATAEYGSLLVTAELRAQAASAGVELPPTDFLNQAAFLDADGAMDASAVKEFIAAIPRPTAATAYSQGLGLGRQGGTAPAGQLSRSDLSTMTPREIAEARKMGKLTSLMLGEF